MHKIVGSDGQMAMTEEEYVQALDRIEQLLDAKAGTPECNERLDLVDLVVQYEEEHGIELWPVDRPVQAEEDIAVFGEEVDRAASKFRAIRPRLEAYGAAVYRAHQRFHTNMDRIEAAAVKWRPQPACPVCGAERMRRNWYGYWACMECEQNAWTPAGAQQRLRDRSAVDAMDHFIVVCQAVSDIRMVLSRLEPHHLNQFQCELLELLEASQVLLLEPNLYRCEQRSVLDDYLEQARSSLAEADDSEPQVAPIPRRQPEED